MPNSPTASSAPSPPRSRDLRSEVSGGIRWPDSPFALVIAIVIIIVDCYSPEVYIPDMDSERLAAIRRRLNLSQEQMARLLGVSFASVNRWESGHSSPRSATRDLYLAIDAAIRAGNAPEAIRQAANGKRSTFLYVLFRMAYAHAARRSR